MTGPELPIPPDPSVRRTLEEAQELALRTGFPAAGAGHLALALLGRAGGWLDGLLQRRFGGLRAGTVTESLRDILELTEDRSGGGPSQAALARAAEVAGACGLREVTCQSLARALFEQPPPPLVEAFRDAGVGASEIESLAGQIPVEGEEASGAAPGIFREGAVHLALLGPTARRAAARMAQRAAAQPDVQMTDLDLLACFLAEEGSRLGEALHVMGLSPSAVRRNLIRSLPPETSARGGALGEGQLSKLLRRVFLEAAALAAAEHSPLISESHLVRAHLDRVGGGAGNVYQRFGIDPARLRTFLERFREDREPASVGLAGSGEAAADDIEGLLRSAVINQDHAIARVVPSLKRMQAGLAEPGRPLGVFLFLGATGVGKTELARAIATLAFGATPGQRDAFLIKLDCGNFKEPRDIVQLLGAPQGLVGYKEGQLTNGLREKPRSVILFDEAEKAHREVWQSLLPLFDEGIVREADGTEHDATNCILIATSNLGYKDAIEEFHLWEKDLGDGGLPQEVQDFVWKRVEEYFSPEFRGRFGRENVIFFRHFDRASYRTLVSLQIRRLVEEMAEKGLAVDVPPEAESLLAGFAWKERQDGARQVRRLVNQHLRTPMADAILADRSRTGFSFVALDGRGEIRLVEGRRP